MEAEINDLVKNDELIGIVEDFVKYKSRVMLLVSYGGKYTLLNPDEVEIIDRDGYPIKKWRILKLAGLI